MPVRPPGTMREPRMTRPAAVLIALALAMAPPASADSSAVGTFVDLEFTGRLRADATLSADTAIAEQVRYTIGQLNGVGAGSRLDRLVVSDVTSRRVGGQIEITYAAVLPSIWRRTPLLPRSVELVLPLDVSDGAQRAFATRYGGTCVDTGAHDVDARVDVPRLPPSEERLPDRRVRRAPGRRHNLPQQVADHRQVPRIRPDPREVLVFPDGAMRIVRARRLAANRALWPAWNSGR